MSVAAPSKAQKSAGNYPKHHLNVRGLRISIENPAGSTRSGTAPDGTEWSTEMKHHYGYIRGTTGKDKDHLDVFLGPEPHAAHPVHIVNQVNEDGEFDEHKVMLGFKSKKDAIEAYHANYEEGWRGADTVATMAFPKFRQWATSGAKRAPAKDIGKIEEPEGYQAGGLVKAATALEQKLVKAGLFDRKLGAVPASAENTNAMPKALEAAAKELGLDEELLVSGSNRPRTRGDDYSAWAFAGRDVPNAYGYANDVWGMRQGPNVQRSAPRLDVFVADPDRRVVAPEGLFDWSRPKDMAREFASEPRVLFRDVLDVEGSPGLAETAEEATARQTQHLIPNLRRSIDMGAVYPLGRPRGQQGYAVGGTVTPLTNLGGYMYGANPVAAGPLSPAATAALIGAPGSDLGSGNGGAFGADAGVSGNTAGGLSPGTIGQALGVAGQLSGTPELGMMGSAIGAFGAAQQGQYGPAGGFLGGMLGGPLGAAAGSLAGQYGSGTLSGKSVANAALGLGIPGYSLANGLSGGALGSGLFGSNGGWSPAGIHSPSVPGVFGDYGATAGQTAVANANSVAGRTGMDPMDALMAVTGAFGTAAGSVNTSGNNSGAVPGGPEDNAPGYGGGGFDGGFGLGSDGGGYGGHAGDGMGGEYQAGGLVRAMKGAPAIVKRATNPIDLQRALDKVVSVDELGAATMGPRISAAARERPELLGYHMTQSLEDLVRAGVLDNSKATNNIQGWKPPHLGGGYFYAHPGLARAQRERLFDAVPETDRFELPILEMYVPKRGLRPDEDTAGKRWQESFDQGSFATVKPVSMANTRRIFTDDVPAVQDQLSRWGREVKLPFKVGGAVPGYADGGSTNAAFGFYPQMQRRKPTNNDRTAAASVPLSAARGWLAGTLGLPGDITSLAKMGVGAVADAGTPGARWVESTNLMPTSEFYNEWLPGRAEGAANRFAEGAGNLFGGVGATTAVRPLERGALRALKIKKSTKE